MAQKRAQQYAAQYEAAFDKVKSMVEHNELGITEADYLEILELFPDVSSPKYESQPAEPILSNEEIESRQRRRVVERLLTGAYGRPIPDDHEQLAKHAIQRFRL